MNDISTGDVSWRVAGRLCEAARLPADAHVVMRENLACYLGQLKADFVESLEHDARPLETVRRGFAHGDQKWTHKILRDLAQPYTDSAMFAHARQVETQLKGAVGTLLDRLGAGTPCKIHLVGSAARERFGGNSDVDVVSDAPAKKAGTLPSFPHVTMFLEGGGGPSLAAFGPHVAFDAIPLVEAKSPLLDLVLQGLMHKGFRVHPISPTEVRVTPPVEVPRHGTESAPRVFAIWSWSDLPA